MSSVKSCMAKMRTYKGHVTRSIGAIDVNIAITKPDIVYINEQLKKLKGYLDETESLSEAIVNLYHDADDETNADKAQDEYATYYLGIQTSIAGYQKKINDLIATGVTTMPVVHTASAASSSASKSVKPVLPKFSIPTFSGDILKWSEFYDVFDSSINSRSDLEDVQKLNYLRQFLADVALEAIEGVPITNSGYKVALDILKKQFALSHDITQAYLKSLRTLEHPVYTRESLQHFYNKVSANIRLLTANGVDKDNYSVMLVSDLNDKLPHQVMTRLVQKKKSSNWTVDDILEVIEEAILTLRVLDNRGTANEKLVTDDANVYLTGASGSSRPNRSRQNNSASQNMPNCALCKGQHYPWFCTVFKTPVSKCDRARTLKLCFCCFSPNHWSTRCTNSRMFCRSCNGRHNTALCLKGQVQDTADGSNREVSHSGTNVHFTSASGAIQDTGTSNRNSAQNPSSGTLVPNSGDPNSDPSNPNPHGSESGSSNESDSVSTCLSPLAEKPRNSMIILQTAQATIIGNSVSSEANIVFDGCSHKNYVSKEFATRLGLKTIRRESLKISVFGTEAKYAQEYDIVNLSIVCIDFSVIEIPAVVVPIVSAPLRFYFPINANSLHPKFNNLKFAMKFESLEPEFDIDVLIGMQSYYKILFAKQVIDLEIDDLPVATNSKLGWLLGGTVKSNPNNPRFNIDGRIDNSHTCISMLTVNAEHTTLDEVVNKFWSLDAVGIKSEELSETPFDHKSYVDSIEYKDGKYVAPLPWKAEHKPLGNNYILCASRAKALVKTLQKKNMLSVYSNVIKTQLESGIISKVDKSDMENGHYIPHFPVYKNSATTPVRPVLNCSFKINNRFASLNDCLEAGPSLHNDIVKILFLFRFNEFGLVSDIAKAFHMVQLAPKDRPYSRFLWLDEFEDPESDIVGYEFNTVVFGKKPAPYMLNATVLKHLLSHPFVTSKELHKMIAAIIVKKIFVDNVLNSVNSSSEAVEFYKVSRSIFEKGNFNLRSWASNCPEVNKLAESESVLDSNLDNVTVLGLKWNTTNDKLYINPFDYNFSSVVTKRLVLSFTCKLYDPLGFLTPISIRSRMFMQQLCLLKINWDQPLSEELVNDWIEIITDLVKASHFSIKRRVANNVSNNKVTVHAFCDSSEIGYGTAIYILNGGSDSNIVLSKGRVTPIKRMSMPRNELLAAVICVRAVEFVKNALEKLDVKCYYWSDSQVALSWIYTNRNLKIYESNRVSEILTYTESKMWNYVPTYDNPSDIITRSYVFDNLLNCNLWWHGPEFIKLTQDQWPTWRLSDFDVPEELQTLIANFSDSDNDEDENETCSINRIIKIENFSKLRTLLNVTAYVNRAFRKNSNKGPLTVKELYKAKCMWIKCIQNEFYSQEIKQLKRDNSSMLIRQLNLRWEKKEGIVRAEGRIHNAPLEPAVKFPILLPPKHYLTKLIILHAHKMVLHSGVSSTMVKVRSEYWVPRLRQICKSFLNKCVICKRITGHHYPYPRTPPLVSLRLKDCSPFTVTGLDYTAAITVYENFESKNVINCYILLYTCATTRNIHLELTRDMTVNSFLLAFRRFCSRRGTPSHLISDNAKTFISADKCIQNLLNSEEINSYFNEVNCKWSFQPKRMPWAGGFFERLIGLTKNTLKKVLGRSRLDFTSFQTLLCEIECVLNERPLTYQSSEIEDNFAPLTPSKLLYGRCINQLPYPNVDLEELNDPDFNNPSFYAYLSKKRAYLCNHFIERWKNEYLTSLRERHICKGSKKNYVQKGHVVLIGESDIPRHKWNLGLVVDVVKGADSLIRSVKLKTKYGITNRPVVKLYPLEVTCSNPEDFLPKSNVHNEIVIPVERPKRQAKTLANQKISTYFDNENKSLLVFSVN